MASYVLLPLVGGLWWLCGILVPIAFGTGLNWPTLSSLASQYAEADTQGAILGVMQSLSALARMLGAAWAGWVFGNWSPGAPFVLNAALMSLAAAFAVLLVIRAPSPREARTERAVGVSV